MSKKIKGLMQGEFKNRFEEVTECVVVSVRGVSGNDNNEMRGELLSKGIRLSVVKNSLARRAFEEMGRGDIKDVLEGPCAIVYGGDSVVDVAKEMVEWAKKLAACEVKGAFLDGKALDAAGALELSKMPNRVELQGQIVNLAMSPGAKVVGAITAPAGVIAGCLKAIIEKGEDAA